MSPYAPDSRHQTADQPPPNVVVVLADDLGWGDLGCYGAEQIPTPEIDRLAAEGARFTGCHTSSAVCTPSRYSLLTGRYCWRSPLKRGVLLGHSPSIIERDRPTTASVLSDHGYATAAIGKWHLGLDWTWLDGRCWDTFAPEPGAVLPDIKSGTSADYTVPFRHGPLELGFDHFFGIAGSLDMPPFCYLEGDRPLTPPDRPKTTLLPQQTMGRQSPDWVDEEVDIVFADETCRWIREQAAMDRPFFIHHATSAPHRPLAVPEIVRGASTAGDRGDLVCLVDWVVGRIRTTLEDLGIADNTVLIVTSDNGAMPFDLSGQTYGHEANGPWRGRKGDIWDGGHRVPFVLRWPERIAPGQVVDDSFCLTDLLATVAEAVGAPVPESASPDGVSRWGQWTGREAAARRPIVHHSYHGWFALRHDGVKTVFGTGSGGFSKPVGERISTVRPTGQLYELLDDPFETTDVWSDRPEHVAAAYDAIRELCGDPSSGLPFNISMTS